ncbi:Adenylosuccinate synthase [Knufia obscura]|uniref:Adenylosuccinate synthetase n=2 Tax=Knufia TaxID=430999 RepID=A0AAN8IQM6_9EURO|nr:Adenylosuccinate synthase [Knufia obscura]KAK5956227.1 Adenylosuccinate synthase [Knufia fluminis]
MPVKIVLGAQWGDEGKGKLVDILCASASMCCRAAGGNNAGHTIVANGITYDFHILPSGLINPSCALNLIGAGCVVHLPSFFKELGALEEKGLQNVRQRVKISDRAQVCFDLHCAVDGISEEILRSKDGDKGMIGTTKKGIGPCYSDKVGRRGVTMGMLVSGQNGQWEKRLRTLHQGYISTYGEDALSHYDLEAEVKRLKEFRTELASGEYTIDATPLLSRTIGNNGKAIQASTQFGDAPETSNGVPPSDENDASLFSNVLIEGANALLLDIDHGTYPYVTSSNTGLGGVFTGLAGLSPLSLTHPDSSIIGVVKAYTTRVGSGPFPSELNNTIPHVSEEDAHAGDELQRIGREFGVTTGRKRRCGWLDMVLVKYSCQVNCYTHLNFTKLDVLDSFEEIKIAMAYRNRRDGSEIRGFPSDLDLMDNEHLEIVYKTMPGWKTETTGTREWDKLPQQAKEYIEFVEAEVGVPIKWIGTGPRREDMIVR